MKKISFTIENRNFDFFQNGLRAKNGQKNDVIMKKNQFLNYKFCFITFWKVLAPYEHFCVTYAIFHFSP